MVSIICPSGSSIFVVAPLGSMDAVPETKTVSPAGVTALDALENAEQWLKTGASYLIADIAPAPAGDEIVNWLDFAVLAEEWLN